MPSHLLQAGFLLDWFSTLKIEVISSSETPIHIRTTRRYIPFSFMSTFQHICICDLICEYDLIMSVYAPNM
jgi:hypothetical protein